MNKLILPVFFFALLSALSHSVSARVYAYSVSVRTVPTAQKQFETISGKLKLEVRGTDASNNDFSELAVLSPEPIDLENDREYKFPLAIQHPLENIRSVNLRWTLKTPYNPIHLIKKPIVYFTDVTLRAEDDSSGRTDKVIKRFCPIDSPLGIAHSESKQLDECRAVLISS